ncbi:hypothetical protein O6H91_02G088100 [Diphasiastrum complanatum]|uniref:Uncharacterized protein n=1 Tax=Diphasiastrum complanatum TaxID=34168 RepID=A0ACC2EHZ0_DIPCM|nr:hypothetical protein O6H91_02G088100 [Diphasiastrum complanatum]
MLSKLGACFWPGERCACFRCVGRLHLIWISVDWQCRSLMLIEMVIRARFPTLEAQQRAEEGRYPTANLSPSRLVGLSYCDGGRYRDGGGWSTEIPSLFLKKKTF